MKSTVRRAIASTALDAEESKTGSRAEWLVTNGLGGYASGTIYGQMTRRYHGLLIAALPAPLGRLVMLSGLIEEIQFADGTKVELGPRRDPPETRESKSNLLSEFRLEMGLPIWRYQIGDLVLERRLHLPYRQNTVQVGYRLLAASQEIEIASGP